MQAQILPKRGKIDVRWHGFRNMDQLIWDLERRKPIPIPGRENNPAPNRENYFFVVGR